MEIKNSVILITGASSGIGEATAKALTNLGAKVALSARSEDKLKVLASELPGSFVIPADLTDSNSIKEMISKTKEHFGRIDILINNAGRGSVWQPVEKIDIDEFKSILDLNVFGQIIAMQEVIPLMRAQGQGSIINIGSGSIHIKKEGASIYPGSKVLFNHISHIARLELAKDNIKVSTLHPYITKTNFFSNIKSSGGTPVSSRSDYMDIGDTPEYVVEKIIELIKTGKDEIDMTIDRLGH